MEPNQLACPVVTETSSPSGTRFENVIHGGLTKRQEIASRIAQGLMGFAIQDNGKPINPKVIVNLSFAYADMILDDTTPPEDPKSAA